MHSLVLVGLTTYELINVACVVDYRAFLSRQHAMVNRKDKTKPTMRFNLGPVPYVSYHIADNTTQHAGYQQRNTDEQGLLKCSTVAVKESC